MLIQPTDKESLKHLTPREKDIAGLVAHGLSNREIGGVSLTSVPEKEHRF
ncbi:hypothetical protein [Halalkalibacter lacteus]